MNLENSSKRSSISLYLRFLNLLIPKSSTANEAIVLPTIVAVFSVSELITPCFAIYPVNPPANESPAPVGSTTFSTGKAGAEKILLLEKSLAPNSPNFITRLFDPYVFTFSYIFIELSSELIVSHRVSLELISLGAYGKSY